MNYLKLVQNAYAKQQREKGYVSFNYRSLIELSGVEIQFSVDVGFKRLIYTFRSWWRNNVCRWFDLRVHFSVLCCFWVFLASSPRESIANTVHVDEFHCQLAVSDLFPFHPWDRIVQKDFVLKC